MTTPPLSSTSSAATSAGDSTRSAIDDVRGAIAAGNAAFAAALGRGDAVGIAACYTADAQLLPPNSDVVGGRGAIETFWRQPIDMGLRGAVLDTAELFHTSGAPTATEVGRYTLTTADGQVVDRGKYVVIWKRDDTDGAWRLHRDIWSSSQPAPTA